MSDALLAIRGLSVSRGGREILRGVDAVVARGEAVAVMAASGGGKTTLLRAICGLLPFEAGGIRVGGVRIEAGRLPGRETRRALTREVGIVFQQHFLFDHLTALENVTLAPCHVLKTPRPEAEERALRLLASLGVGARAGALPRELSGGESQRVAIARALAMDPPLLLMDEPTAALDPARRGRLAEALRELLSEGRALLLTTHDAEFVRRAATRVVVLAGGALVEEGDPEAVLARPAHPATQQLLRSDGPSSQGGNAPRGANLPGGET